MNLEVKLHGCLIIFIGPANNFKDYIARLKSKIRLWLDMICLHLYTSIRRIYTSYLCFYVYSQLLRHWTNWLVASTIGATCHGNIIFLSFSFSNKKMRTCAVIGCLLRS